MFLSISRKNEKVSCIIVHPLLGVLLPQPGAEQCEKNCFAVSSARDGLDGDSRGVDFYVKGRLFDS